jgi:hypothetical protein
VSGTFILATPPYRDIQLPAFATTHHACILTPEPDNFNHFLSISPTFEPLPAVGGLIGKEDKRRPRYSSAASHPFATLLNFQISTLDFSLSTPPPPQCQQKMCLFYFFIIRLSPTVVD